MLGDSCLCEPFGGHRERDGPAAVDLGSVDGGRHRDRFGTVNGCGHGNLCLGGVVAKDEISQQPKARIGRDFRASLDLHLRHDSWRVAANLELFGLGARFGGKGDRGSGQSRDGTEGDQGAATRCDENTVNAELRGRTQIVTGTSTAGITAWSRCNTESLGHRGASEAYSSSRTAESSTIQSMTART